MTPRPRALVLVLAVLAACARASTIAPAGTSAGATSADITEADLRRRLFLIADDSMMGRETGSEGAYKATEYIASEFRRLGLEPAGESGSYFQTVPFWRAAIGPGSRLEITPTPSMSVKRVSLVLGRDWIPSSFRG